MIKKTILIVDDDAAFREMVVEILKKEGYHILEAASGEAALTLVAQQPIDLVLTDQKMPGISGIELANRLRSGSSPPQIIVMTAYGTISKAVKAIQVGAADYLTKPLESPAVLRALVGKMLQGTNKRRTVSSDNSGVFLTRDPATLEVLMLADRAASTDTTILINGESGTGKELLARRVHQKSPRRDGPFVPVNCAALPETLAESELFGHERGAFTGAVSTRKGKFENAHQGTIFLDEVGELSEAVQAKLLRVLEDRKLERVGGSRLLDFNIRVVSATNRDLEAEVLGGRFREDLFYRLNVVELKLPPLRNRAGDVDLLIADLLPSIAGRLGLPARQLEPAALECLRGYAWPGNIRELRNTLERALIAASGDKITRGDLPRLLWSKHRGSPDLGGGDDIRAVKSIAERGKVAVLEALRATDGHRGRAAEYLGISVRTLYNWLKKYGIE